MTIILELLIGISSFIGGIFMTSGVVKIYQNWQERRELERRTEELYNSFIEGNESDDNNEINVVETKNDNQFKRL